jgi:hypothetical protein
VTTELSASEIDLLNKVRRRPALEVFLFKKIKHIKWLNELVERGYFECDKMPKPEPAESSEGFVIRQWPQVGYLSAIAPELKTATNKRAATTVRDIIRQVTRDAIAGAVSNYQVWWRFAKIASQIPVALLDASDLKLVDYWLSDRFDRDIVGEEIGSWVLDLLRDGSAHALDIAHGLALLLFHLRPEDVDAEDAALRIKSWTAGQLEQKLAGPLGSALGARGVAVFSTQLAVLLQHPKGRRDPWSQIWRPAIEPNEQNLRSDSAEQVLIDGFRDSLMAFAKQDAPAAAELMTAILKGKSRTPKRVVIFTVAQQFDRFKDLIPQLLTKKYLGTTYQHEMWHLLQDRYAAFESTERASVIRLIQREVIKDEHGKRDAKRTAYRQATWYSALQNHGSRERKLYQAAVKVAGGAPERPDFSSYHFGGPVAHGSLYTVTELLSLSAEELAQRLRDYQPDDETFLPKHDARGLGKAVQQVFATNPATYYSQLRYFEDLDLDFVHAIFEAFQQIWGARKPQAWPALWEHILIFAEHLTSSDSALWLERAEQKPAFLKANPSWIVSDIASLIESGTRNDAKAMPKDLVHRGQALLDTLLQRVTGSAFEPKEDAVSVAINTARGYCIRALVNLALHRCRVLKRDGKAHVDVWRQELLPLFERELEAVSAQSFEFIVLAISYLPNLLFLSPEWTKQNFDRLFGRHNEMIWLCAMQAYAQLAHIDRSVYFYMKNAGHLQRALDEPRLRDRVHEKIIQSIAFGFYAGFEDFDQSDSLISLLIARNKPDELAHLIWFFWTLRDGPSGNERLRQKMSLLWPRLLAQIDTATRDGRLLASRLCPWMEIIEALTPENLPWIEAVVPFADENHNSYSVLQSLARLSARQPREAAEVWKLLLSRSRAHYPIEAIKTLFQNILTLDDGDRVGNRIASLYAGMGNDEPLALLNQMLDYGTVQPDTSDED